LSSNASFSPAAVFKGHYDVHLTSPISLAICIVLVVS
jgi:hypothetical protein